MKLNISIDIDPKDLAALLKAVEAMGIPQEEAVNIPQEEQVIPVEEELVIIREVPIIPEEPVIPIEEPIEEVPEVLQEETDMIDFTEAYYLGVKSGSIILESGKTYRVGKLLQMPISYPLVIKTTGEERANLIIGIENYEPRDGSQSGFLFYLKDGAEVLIDNVNLCQPAQLKSTQAFLPSLFNSEQNPKAKWTAVVRNCDTTARGRKGGFGIGFVYGGLYENHIGIFNFKHIGPGFIDGKNPYENGVLYLTMQDVEADFSNKTEFGSNHLKVTGYVKDNVFTITSEHTLDFLFNNFFVSDKNDNRATILHLGRYTFMLDDIEAVINPKQIRLRPMADGSCLFEVTGEKMYCVGKEIHAGDLVDGAKVIEKDRDNHPFWSNDHNPLKSDISYTPYIKLEKNKNLLGRFTLEVQSSWDQEGIEQEAYLIYKANDSFRTTPKTIFGDPNNWNKILSGEAVGHQWYIHAGPTGITLDARRLKSTGFFRQTQHGAGKSLGFNMVDCSGFKDEAGKWRDEFKPYNLTETDQPIHERVAKYLP